MGPEEILDWARHICATATELRLEAGEVRSRCVENRLERVENRLQREAAAARRATAPWRVARDAAGDGNPAAEVVVLPVADVADLERADADVAQTADHAWRASRSA